MTDLGVNVSKHHNARVAAFAELGQIVHGDVPLDTILQRIAEQARQLIPELTEVSVTLIDNGRPRTVVFTGTLASYLDERQYEAGFGPCTDAAISGNTIIVDTADSTSPYAGFGTIAARHGIRHVVSVGLPIPQRTVGALNMYSDTEGPISADSVGLAEAFAIYAGVAVANAALYQATASQAEDMLSAMRSRAVIEQAKGIIIAQRHCSPEEAFAVLARTSQTENVKLRDLAVQLSTVFTSLRFDRPDGRFRIRPDRSQIRRQTLIYRSG